MSSHHFVKEGQELPLVVLDWNVHLAEIASQLLGWQPLFVVKQDLLKTVLDRGLKPDVILCPDSTESYDCLLPIEFWEEMPPKQLMILTSENRKECINLVLKNNNVVYTEKYKYFKISNPFVKVWVLKNEIIELFDIQNNRFEKQVATNDGFLDKKLPNSHFILVQEI